LAASLLGKDHLLPSATRVIALDPAALEEALREARALSLRYERVAALLNDLSTTTEDGRRAGLLHWAWQALCPTDPDRAQAWADEVNVAMKSAESFFAALHIAGQGIFHDLRQRGEAHPRNDQHQHTAAVDREIWRRSDWRRVVVAWDECRGAFDSVMNLLRAIANEVEAQAPRASSELAAAVVELLFAARQLEAVRDTGDELLAPVEPQLVTWIDRPDDAGERPASPRGGRVSGSPVKYDTNLLGVYPRYGDAVRPLTMNGNGLALAGPGLASGGDFAFSRRMFGLAEETRGANLGRDRSEQTLLCLPSDVPEPNTPHYQERLNQALIRLALELDGRLVVYFASRNSLKEGAQGIRHTLERQGFAVLAQGFDGPAQRLWRAFNRERRAVLLGGSLANADTEHMRRSYCVVFPRLLLPAESDPVVAARAEYWDQPYDQYLVPTAAQRMRIALARLAWSHERRNAVVLFDRRAHTRDSGHATLATLPRCQELRSPLDEIAREVAEWIGPA
jgi:Rad3-related DNA helicase